MKCFGVQAAGVGVDVGQDHVAAEREDGAERRVVGECRSHDVHAFAHTECEVGGEEGAGTGVEGDREAGSAVQKGEEFGLQPADGTAVALDGDVDVPLPGQFGQLRLVGGGRPDLVGQRLFDGGCASEEGELFGAGHMSFLFQAHRSASSLRARNRSR
ncbi:hypothetical protein GCM10010387_50570 [Streptomyces inusitatus]|uniref:Uncharacterized protein n=1 Tax=Streptomyces inusitatus TaxID=68221 RepID=A0A918QJJ8_9ACTN|nr:hypothetical protein GCM10010387_50570 [Streptomyces inusitatus]